MAVGVDRVSAVTVGDVLLPVYIVAAAGNPSRKWPPRLSSRRSAARAISSPTVTRLRRGASRGRQRAARARPRRRARHASSCATARSRPSRVAQQARIAPHQHRARRRRDGIVAARPIGDVGGHGTHVGVARLAASAAAAAPSSRRPRARRTRALRAANCWPAGWRRGRRCRRPRPRQTARQSTCGRRGRSRRRPSRSARPG